jgi:hypothetical protein
MTCQALRACPSAQSATAPDAGLLEYTEYNYVKKDATIAESTFVHEKFTGNDTHLVRISISSSSHHPC